MSAQTSKLVKAYFEKFSTTTVIRVFNFIRTSAYLVERLFWLAVLLGFSICTIWNVTDTVKMYISEPTASQVVFFNNETTPGLNFSSTIMCLESGSSALEKLYGSKMDEVIAKVLSSPINYMLTLRQKLDSVHDAEERRIALLKSFAQQESAPNFTEEMNSRLQSFYEFKQSNIDVFSKSEIAFVALTTVMLGQLIEAELDPGAVLNLQLLRSASIQKLHRVFIEQGTNFSELLTLTAEMTCVLLQVRLVAVYPAPFTGVNSYAIYNFCRRFSSPLFYLGPGKDKRYWICYRVGRWPDFPVFFKSPLDTITFTLHRESLYKDSIDQQITLEFGGRLFAMQTQPLAFNVKQIVDVKLATVTVMANLRRSGCLQGGKGLWSQCAQWCGLESIVRGCNCMPLISGFLPKFVSLPAGLQSCATSAIFSGPVQSVGYHDQCLHALSTYDPTWKNCSQQCYDRDCEMWYIATEVSPNDPTLDSINASTVIRLFSSNFVHEKVVEYVTMDSKGFVAALGSNLSLYLGASFLALIHIIVFFVRLPFDYARDQGQPSQKEAVQHPVSASAISDANLLRTLVDDVSSIRRHTRALDRRLQRVELRQARGGVSVL